VSSAGSVEGIELSGLSTSCEMFDEGDTEDERFAGSGVPIIGDIGSQSCTCCSKSGDDGFMLRCSVDGLDNSVLYPARRLLGQTLYGIRTCEQ